jgi:uncharacterized protein (TIGR00251 family)
VPNPSQIAGRVKIYVQPQASKTEVAGMFDGCVKVRLAAPPVDGAANRRLIEFVAAKLGVSKSSVRLIAGASSRRKVLEVAGMSREAIELALGR